MSTSCLEVVDSVVMYSCRSYFILTVLYFLSQPPTSLTFNVIDYKDGADDCRLSLYRAECRSERGAGVVYAGGSPDKAINCPSVPDNVDLRMVSMLASCCIEEDNLNLSCIARSKKRKCAEGYYWTSRDSNGDRVRNTFFVHGPMTISLSYYKPRHISRNNYDYHAPETMWYQSKTYSNTHSNYTAEILCDGTVTIKAVKGQPDSYAVVIGCSVGIPLGVTAIVVGCLICCYWDRIKSGSDGVSYSYTDRSYYSARPRESGESPTDIDPYHSYVPPSDDGDPHSENNGNSHPTQAATSSASTSGGHHSALEDPDVRAWRSCKPVHSTTNIEERASNTSPANRRSTNVLNDPDVQAWRRGVASTEDVRHEADDQTQESVPESLPNYDSLFSPPPDYSEVLRQPRNAEGPTYETSNL